MLLLFLELYYFHWLYTKIALDASTAKELCQGQKLSRQVSPYGSILHGYKRPFAVFFCIDQFHIPLHTVKAYLAEMLNGRDP